MKLAIYYQERFYLKMFIYDIFDTRSNELTNVITGISDINSNVDITITPNPAINSLFINGLNEIAKISICDLNRLIAKYQIVNILILMIIKVEFIL